MRKLYRFMIEFYWKIEHIHNERMAILGFKKRKLWENRYIAKFHENIYGQPL